MVMAPQLYCLVCLVAFVEFQCHAFKPLSQRSTLSLSGNLLRSRSYYSWHRSTSLPSSLYSIRGGSSEQEIDDEYDEDDTSYYEDFIASFESELAEIRREAELEAENEMKKLLGLVDNDEAVEDNDEEEEEEDYETDEE